MRNWKCLAALFTAAVLALALSVPAFAAGTGFTGGDGPATRAQTAAVMRNLAKVQDDPVPSPGERNKVLVAYFSATNTTRPLAEYIADSFHTDLYEIVPQIPYTSDDLNYSSSSSRTTAEMNDPNARPAISGGANWLDGRRFSGGTSRDTMVEWVNSLGLDIGAD